MEQSAEQNIKCKAVNHLFWLAAIFSSLIPLDILVNVLLRDVIGVHFITIH